MNYQYNINQFQYYTMPADWRHQPLGDVDPNTAPFTPPSSQSTAASSFSSESSSSSQSTAPKNRTSIICQERTRPGPKPRTLNQLVAKPDVCIVKQYARFQRSIKPRLSLGIIVQELRTKKVLTTRNTLSGKSRHIAKYMSTSVLNRGNIIWSFPLWLNGWNRQEQKPF